MSYNTLKIYGDCDVNYMMCSSLVLSDEDIQVLKTNSLSAPTWETDTIMLANFNKDLNADNLSMVNEITGYRIQRFEVDYNKLYEVAKLNREELYFEDYNIINNKNYQYYIAPIYLKDGKELFGSPIATETIYADWIGWTIVGTKPTNVADKYTVDYDNIWTFECNVESEAMRSVFNKTYTTGFGQYPKAVQGQENYLEGSVQCLLGNVLNNKYINDNIDIIEKWRNFCNNGELKLLKDPKGHVIPCSIKDTTSTLLCNSLEQPTVISFNFVQLMDKRDISVYGLGA